MSPRGEARKPFVDSRALVTMSKLNAELISGAIDKILEYSEGKTIQVDGKDVKGMKRKFVETIDLQIALKNYDPQRDKRFSGTFKLPVVPRPNLKCCIIGNAVHCEEAERIGVDKMSVDDLKKFNKNKMSSRSSPRSTTPSWPRTR